MPARSLLFAAFALASSGCFLPGWSAPDDSPPPIQDAVATEGAPAAWSVAVGTGHDSYVALAENDPVEKVHGSQGGYHVWTSLLVRGDAPRTAMIELEVSSPSGVVSRTASASAGAVTPAGTTYTGLYAYVDASTAGPIMLRATVTEAEGSKRWARSTKNVVVR